MRIIVNVPVHVHVYMYMDIADIVYGYGNPQSVYTVTGGSGVRLHRGFFMMRSLHISKSFVVIASHVTVS